ncbi:hypothetical protein [Rhizohabitans arisaemae]|uniref:hypothetical protein n=1 Tax=Rhizohabitans arisaemae TaxID=2720610 RepID=UPI0024B0EA7C|nr:hypothetical protein [Rhizohabitans arisaemae]
MYGWLWRRLPGTPAIRTATCVLLAALTVAGLWFVAFPWLETWIAIDHVTVHG